MLEPRATLARMLQVACDAVVHGSSSHRQHYMASPRQSTVHALVCR